MKKLSKIIYHIVFLLPVLMSDISSAEIKASNALGEGLGSGPYEAGYRVFYFNDASRSCIPGVNSPENEKSGPCWRHIHLHLWYPAETGAAQFMRYKDYVIASDFDYSCMTVAIPETGDQEKGIVERYKNTAIRRGADPTKLDSILAAPTTAIRDASPARGRFPLILYSPSINSDPFENAILFEHLASWGYVIAAAPSIGLYELEVSRDEKGALAAIQDLGCILNEIWDKPYIDATRIGILGYSWGGMAALLFGLPHNAISAIASLDGALAFREYRPVAESFPIWNLQDLRAAFLDIILADEPRISSTGAAARYADSYLLKIPGLSHRDLSADFIFRYRLAPADTAYSRVADEFVQTGRLLRVFFDAYLKQDEEKLHMLRNENIAIPKSQWTYKEKLPAPPTPDQFDRIIEERGVEAAVSLYDQLRERDPDIVLFDESRLLRFAYSWGPDRADELMGLLNLNQKAYPRSADTHFWKAQVYLEWDEISSARKELERTLVLNPEHVRANRLMGMLDSGTD